MKRRGFTLIELMVVIAIIIILAAIAIPNYLNMTARAKKSRVASDFAALATALETYKADWNEYPVSTGHDVSTAAATGINAELTGTNTAAAAAAGVRNLAAGASFTASGDVSPIVYITQNILTSMKNPYDSTSSYKYLGTISTWKLSAATNDTTTPFWVRTDLAPTLASGTTAY